MKYIPSFCLFFIHFMTLNGQQHRPEAYLKAYPQHIKAVTANTIIWHDGTEMVFDDGKNKTLQEKLDNADLEDQLSQPYPLGPFSPPTAYNDPGRMRYEAFFKKMYGQSAEAVRQKLVTVVWLPKHLGEKIQVTQVNGVAEQVRKLSAALDERPHLIKYVRHIGGTFNWRKISGTNRLSMHSFGMTIDINTAFSHYWQWDNSAWRTKGEQVALSYRNSIPLELVELFETYGFIWGGKWYHYDTMHFEYRPELLLR